MDEDEQRTVVIVERGYVADATGSVKETCAGETVFKHDAVSDKNRIAIEFDVRTDNLSAGAVITVFGISGKDGNLLDFFARFAYLAD